MTPEEIADIQVDLLEFSKYVFKARKGIEFIVNKHHQLICDALEKVFIGETTRLIINIPPRYSKTELAVINFMSWCMGLYPDSEFIHASYSKRLATLNAWTAKTIIESEDYQSIFPVELQHDSKAKDEFRTSNGGCIYATGAEGTITGYGAGKMRDGFGGAIIIDDPHKAGEANSDTMRNNVIEWFTTTIESRVNSKDTPIIVIMQRLHENDLSGWLLEGGNGEEWEHLNIPAIDENNEPLWEFKHSMEDLLRMQASNSYVFAGQYMQTPSPLGGGIIKQEWIQKTYDIPDLDDFDFFFSTADTAQKANNWNDFSVLMFWGVYDDELWLLDMRRGKWESPQLHAEARAFFTRHNRGNFRKFWIEDKSSGIGLIQDLRADGLPVGELQADKDKITRTMNVTRYMENGQVFIDASIPDVEILINEMLVFPNASHDDAHDTFMYGLTVAFITGTPEFYFGVQQ